MLGGGVPGTRRILFFTPCPSTPPLGGHLFGHNHMSKVPPGWRTIRFICCNSNIFSICFIICNVVCGVLLIFFSRSIIVQYSVQNNQQFKTLIIFPQVSRFQMDVIMHCWISAQRVWFAQSWSPNAACFCFHSSSFNCLTTVCFVMQPKNFSLFLP